MRYEVSWWIFLVMLVGGFLVFCLLSVVVVKSGEFCFFFMREFFVVFEILFEGVELV